MENTTIKYSELNRTESAYTVLSYLVSDGEMQFAEMRDLLGISHNGNWYRSFLMYIVNRIEGLKEKWGENIPPITALIFHGNGKASKWSCGLLM